MKYIAVGILSVLIFVFGFFLGRMTASSPLPLVDEGSMSGNSEPATSDMVGGDTEGTTIDTSQMSEGQRQMLKLLGIDADNITITAEMVACAEAKVGAGRVEEIKNGATPTFMEGAALVGCYSQ